MSSLETRKIEPQSGTTVTLGAGGDTVLVSADQLKTNTVKDAGGNTLFTSDGAGTLSSINAAFPGSMTFISSQTAPAGTSSLSFTSGIDSTYDEYVFYCLNMNPSVGGAGADGPYFQWQCNKSGQSGFNETITSTAFGCYNSENPAGSNNLAYSTGMDQAQGSGYQYITGNDGSASDQGSCCELRLYNPSSTTYVKQFDCHASWSNDDDPPYAWQLFTAGYVNVTGALTEFDFKMSSGTFSGTIYLYGIS